MSRPRFLRPGWLLVALLLVGALWVGGRRALGSWGAKPWPDGVTEPREDSLTFVVADDTLARPPAGVRVRVQVLNATRTRGLARRAMLHLRDHGFDVVETGTASPTRGRTLVLDRSGHPDWARRIAHAMGGAAVEARPDSSRYLDVTVLVGADWRPPAQPFHP